MRYLKAFIIKATQDAFEKDKSSNPEPQNMIEPALPKSPIDVSDEVRNNIQSYEKEALDVYTFEEFMNLINKIVAELNLDADGYNDKVAAILNSYRAENKLPLL